ncbi:McrB family protein [Bradyrhizobium diazoefficiens]|uniref:GTPase n=1 Tax=Bradyrhizobium diazoefficiens TaxID=1355477 RepID=A0A809Y7C7_9BRAD|nr:AAA family ATPase [Bradyrhizobium diazoefficiens]BBZ99835.1 GTPase [Bradyrhizobium diazoefficiens]BCA17520.1 GTPase [Bradyrhizobium diazoefficiens]BCE35704.1 GTPase [Bradyrhizobium diazoefficiens]BCF49097.1 GTPase [Bradyrhizobium diazoefficiens]
MARITDHDSSRIFDAAREWRDQCLVAGKSLLWGDRELWSPSNLQRFKACFIDRPDLSKDKNFEQKFKAQLAAETDDVTRLACELLFVYFLFPTSVGRPRKTGLIREVANWRSLEANDKAPLFDAFDTGIGDPGLVYNTGRPNELTYLARFAIAVADKPESERLELLHDHLRARALLDDLAEAHREEFGRPPQSRHILLFLLFPDDYERIASEGHKARICEAFSEIIEGEKPEDVDDQLKAIRQRLTELLSGRDLDFYWEPLRACWYTDGESETLGALPALHIKQQIVLYGPPGTGKTYQARVIASSLIRQELLKLWGPRRFFSTSDTELSEIIAARTHRVQFHPGYGYEDFVRGLQIAGNGQTEYRDGVLLRLVGEMQREPVEEHKIPVVLILDEMNRADLSKVLGECFSLLEDRDTEVQLGGHDEKPRKVRLPARLYVIGTMNLIDQSLEHVDFALRRRFLWFFRGFSREDFLAVSQKRWSALLEARQLRRDWEKVEAEFEILADRALRLNEIIDGNGYLGSQYEIGHTYFCDVVSFAHRYLMSSEKRRNRVLFNGRGMGLDPVVTLWRYSLAPLLTQYLSGIDSAEREALLTRAASVLLAGQGS